MSSATGASGHSHSNAPITLSPDELILHSDAGVPYVIPEVALLFEAKHLRLKDQDDFRNVLPALTQSRRLRLRDWLTQTHPGHPWIEALHDRRDCPGVDFASGDCSFEW
ncbi:hypothetical protein [Mycolicibacterium sp. P9-22]|uniref:hypothetical protein n=1 Tax=Mycolicibacterium sp. P9-22 TaxID=2024613 RepID=UPI0011F050B9|nr:hypothetical protein [Mycolicibacterium sp. P9-22]KAA0113932.1 hypothetical protein CIW51_21220 [Mycolicibacterium sp. P9-22]